MLGCVIDQIVRVDDAFIATEHKIMWVNKWDVRFEPVLFGGKRLGVFHGGGDNKDVVLF